MYSVNNEVVTMRKLFFTLFLLTISLIPLQNVYSNEKNKQIRMSISGIYNGDYKETYDDNFDEMGRMYKVDKTCLRIEHLIFKGNFKNVTISILCSDGTEKLTKRKVNINGIYKLPVLRDKYDNCYYDEGVQNIIIITNQSGGEIYRCEITGSICEV